MSLTTTPLNRGRARLLVSLDEKTQPAMRVSVVYGEDSLSILLRGADADAFRSRVEEIADALVALENR